MLWLKLWLWLLHWHWLLLWLLLWPMRCGALAGQWTPSARFSWVCVPGNSL